MTKQGVMAAAKEAEGRRRKQGGDIPQLPGYIVELLRNHDPLVHTSFNDIVFLVQSELDLYDEGEPSDVRSSTHRRKAGQWIRRQAD